MKNDVGMCPMGTFFLTNRYPKSPDVFQLSCLFSKARRSFGYLFVIFPWGWPKHMFRHAQRLVHLKMEKKNRTWNDWLFSFIPCPNAQNIWNIHVHPRSQEIIIMSHGLSYKMGPRSSCKWSEITSINDRTSMVFITPSLSGVTWGPIFWPTLVPQPGCSFGFPLAGENGIVIVSLRDFPTNLSKCLEKVTPKIFSQMVVKNGEESPWYNP